MPLLFFEFLGTTELMVILVAALVLFGPRKLPEISRQIGKGLAEFRKASDDFRQTWEKEVQREFSVNEVESSRTIPAEEKPVIENTIGRGHALNSAVENDAVAPDEATIQPGETNEAVDCASVPESRPEPTRKRDWI